MDVKPKAETENSKVAETVDLILKVLPLAMGVAVVALSALGQLDQADGMVLLGIGLSCMAIRQMKE